MRFGRRVSRRMKHSSCVVGLDFDQDVKKQVCEVKGDDVVLWDSITRHRNGSLRHVSEECMLDTLHWAAKVGREQNTGAARSLIEDAHLIGDPTLLTALEALLNVLPPTGATTGRITCAFRRGQRLRGAGASAQAGLLRNGAGAEDTGADSAGIAGGGGRPGGGRLAHRCPQT